MMNNNEMLWHSYKIYGPCKAYSNSFCFQQKVVADAAMAALEAVNDRKFETGAAANILCKYFKIIVFVQQLSFFKAIQEITWAYV